MLLSSISTGTVSWYTEHSSHEIICACMHIGQWSTFPSYRWENWDLRSHDSYKSLQARPGNKTLLSWFQNHLSWMKRKWIPLAGSPVPNSYFFFPPSNSLTGMAWCIKCHNFQHCGLWIKQILPECITMEESILQQMKDNAWCCWNYKKRQKRSPVSEKLTP